jgi:tetratricopeptide (TPR) repeat protein
MKPRTSKVRVAFPEAVALFKQGNVVAAEALCLSIPQGDPLYFDAQHLAGLAALQAGRHEESVTCLQRAVAINNKDATLQGNLGLALMLTGRLQDALQALENSLALDPESSSNEFCRGQVLVKLQRLDDAVMAFRRTLELRPDDAIAYQFLGQTLSDLGRLEEALGAHEKASELQPDQADHYANIAGTLSHLRRHSEIPPFVEKALQLQPGHEVALIGRIDALIAAGKLNEALATAEELLAAHPDSLQGHIWRSKILVFMGQPERALQLSAAMRNIALDHPSTHVNQGWILTFLNRFREAIICYDRAIKLKPDDYVARHNRAFALLSLGQFEEGWYEHEYRNLRQKTLAVRRYPKPLWWGKVPIKDQRLFLYCEQGLGDAIQFSRYAILAADQGANVVFSVHQPLRRLFDSFDPRILVVNSNQEPTDFDLHCPLVSLPLAFNTKLTTIPAFPEGYLKAPANEAQAWTQRLPSGRRRIGMVWSGSPIHANDLLRSIPLARLMPLFQTGDAWVSLQKDVRESDRPALEASGILDLTAELGDFADTAALIAALDLVVTVDTSVAHLAGALGKPVWLMLPFSPDFRWLLRREDSPWYPSMRLFRQQKPGDWDSVIARISQALEVLQ